jgi:sulfur carrier protein
MLLQINGAPREVPDGQTVADLLSSLGIRGRIAVEVNGELVPRSAHAQHVLADGDRVEVVHAIGGGQTDETARSAGRGA